MTLIWELGCIEYAKALELQRQFHRQRLLEEIPDVLLLLEHPPTLAVGRTGAVRRVLALKERLEEEGVSLFFIDRGRAVTYHGPGQIVAYPIMDLKARGKDIRHFSRSIEETIIRTMSDFSIKAGRCGERPGVCVKGRELAAIDLGVRRWVSMRSFAINVDTTAEPAVLDGPGGFAGRKTTSMATVLGRNVSLKAVKERLMMRFTEAFDERSALKFMLAGHG